MDKHCDLCSYFCFRSVVIFGSGVIITKSISCYSGLIMYAHYADCDPLKAGLIHRKDQLLPYYVLDVAGHIFGLPGLFISGVFSTALRYSLNTKCPQSHSSVTLGVI